MCFFCPETCTLPVRVHALESTPIDAHVLLDPDYCIIPYDVYYQYFQQFPDIVMQTTRIKTTKIDNIFPQCGGKSYVEALRRIFRDESGISHNGTDETQHYTSNNPGTRFYKQLRR
jgi:hypothetical protein